ncbi:MAG: hypothetical protein KDA87_00645 [Planctomycetales bacterium]|nr:hypothetical protein [Planctomycetales bacterium]
MNRFMNATITAQDAIQRFAWSIERRLSADPFDMYRERPLRKTVTCWKCGGGMTVQDFQDWSQTLACQRCHNLSLVIDTPSSGRVIPLQLLRRFRFAETKRRPNLNIEFAYDLIDSLKNMEHPSSAAETDFGLRQDAHIGVMWLAIWRGCSAYELSRVVGDGGAISLLVSHYIESNDLPPFWTTYDATECEDPLSI